MEFLQTNPHQASANQVGSLPTAQDHIFSKMSGNTFTLNVKHSIFHSSQNLPKLKPNQTDTPWIIDTRATDHRVNCLLQLQPLCLHPVKLPNGDLVSITHIGTVRISEHLILTNVLCVPSYAFTATKLIKQLNCCLIFITSYCFIQNLTNWKTIGLGEERGGLFHLLQPASKFFANPGINSATLKNSLTDLWHFRLGHLSNSFFFFFISNNQFY
jgi:hypothetical protein